MASELGCNLLLIFVVHKFCFKLFYQVFLDLDMFFFLSSIFVEQVKTLIYTFIYCVSETDSCVLLIVWSVSCNNNFMNCFVPYMNLLSRGIMILIWGCTCVLFTLVCSGLVQWVIFETCFYLQNETRCCQIFVRDIDFFH